MQLRGILQENILADEANFYTKTIQIIYHHEIEAIAGFFFFFGGSVVNLAG